MSILFLVIGLAILIWLTMRGVNIIIAAVAASAFIALTNGQSVLQSLLDTYMKGFTNYFASWFLLFLLGAIFGKIMGETRAAEAIAFGVIRVFGPKWAILATVLACAIMTYGGVSLFVVGFSVYPFALSLFRQANLPRRFIPAALVFGSVTFTMFLPGSPEIQNIIPTKFFHTTPYSGFGVAIIVAILNFVSGILYLHWVTNRAVMRGERFEERRGDTLWAREAAATSEGNGLPNIVVAILPIVVVIVGLAVLSRRMDATPATIYALLLGIVAACVLMFKYMKGFWRMLGIGANEALLAACNTSAVVAFGSVAATTVGFQQVVQAITHIPGPPLLSMALTIDLICGLTGSASGGLGIALPILAPMYLKMGIDPGALHRVSVIASDGLASLPHNGYIVTTIQNICGETHRQAYGPVAMIAVVLMTGALAVAITLFSIFG